MERESLYVSYIDKYKEYINKLKKVAELKESIKRDKRKSLEEQKDLQLQYDQQLAKLNNQQQLYENQLAVVQKDGKNSVVAKEFSTSTLKKIEAVEKNLKVFQNQASLDEQSLTKDDEQQKNKLEKKKKQCQQELEQLLLKERQTKSSPTFNEKQLRVKLTQEKDKKVAALSRQHDEKIEEIQQELKQLSSEYASYIKGDMALLEKPSPLSNAYNTIKTKVHSNDLPKVLVDALDEPIDRFVERKELKDSKAIFNVASNASMLDDLKEYTPNWLGSFINFGIPILLGIGLFLFFYLNNVEFEFVTTASNAVATFLVRIICAAIGGAIGYFILGGILGRPFIGAIAAIFGVVIGFSIVSDFGIQLPMSFTNTIQWIVKILICGAAIAGALSLTTFTNVGEGLISLALFLPPFKNIALAEQGRIIEGKLDSYYALLNVKELISYVTNKEMHEVEVELKEDLTKQQKKKLEEIAAFKKKQDEEQERKIKEEKKLAETKHKNHTDELLKIKATKESCQQQLLQYEDQLQKMSAQFTEQLQKLKESYKPKIENEQNILTKLKKQLDENTQFLLNELSKDIETCHVQRETLQSTFAVQLQKLKEKFNETIRATENELRILQETLWPDFEALYALLTEKYLKSVPQLQETNGVVSNVFCTFNQNELTRVKKVINQPESFEESTLPVKLQEIRHDKNPMVFLYDDIDSSKIATHLFGFMDAVNIGLYLLNYQKIYDLYITDPVSKGINFKSHEEKKRLKIVNDIKELYTVISESMDFIAVKGQTTSIDDHNKQLIANGDDEEDIHKFGKYKIVQIIVPEEDSAQNTDFFSNDIWTRFETSQKHGFIPIFYIKKVDWENALNDENKFNSKFIQKLNKALGYNKENIYVIDAQNISITQYKTMVLEV